MDLYDSLEQISCSLHTKLNAIIGTEVTINIRRTTTNLRDDIYRIQHELANADYIPSYSGSRAEGLRFKSSDDDWMYIYRDIKVIPSASFTSIYDRNTTLLMMENEMTKPGFTLLRLIGQTTKPMVTRSIEHIMNGRYLSCKRWRELHTFKSEFTHGPCASGTIGPYEYDNAYCLRYDTWPTNAQDCIRRLQQSTWPPHDTILSIVNDGVLFVPIGAKQSIFENNEWRMSFSLAEKKLIHTMNHTQFLCYGLLKIFLKEAIDVNSDVKDLLCSYFLKTALFWEITTTSNQWNPSTLMSRFWNCFHRLLQWVSCSYCPNFFIPQNNMFEGKIEGRHKDKLLQHLTILFYEGYQSLLRCKSLADVKLTVLRMNYVSMADQIIGETHQHIEFHMSDNCIQSVLMYLFDNITSSHQSFILKTWLHRFLTYYCCSNANSSAARECHRTHYSNLTQRMNILRRCRTDSVSHFLYQAMLCYNNGRYTRTLRLITQSKEKVSQPRAIHIHNATARQFRAAGLHHFPLETMLRRHFVEPIKIEKEIHIPELYLEWHIRCANSEGRVVIPPLVMAFFLQYLCQRKLSEPRKADDTLNELSLLVQYDDGHHIFQEYQETSWHILGICQQMSGDDQAACQSFMKAQLQFGKELLKFATCVRLGMILVKYF